MAIEKENLRQIPLIVIAFLFWIACWYPAWASPREEDVAAIQKVSQAFTRAAKTAIPTVVFINAAQTATTSATPFHYNNPFELLEDKKFRIWSPAFCYRTLFRRQIQDFETDLRSCLVVFTDLKRTARGPSLQRAGIRSAEIVACIGTSNNAYF